MLGKMFFVEFDILKDPFEIYTRYLSHTLKNVCLYRYGILRDLSFYWIMMTSSYGNIPRVTGHVCGELAGHRWILLTKASDAELWCFFDMHLNKWLSKPSWGWWFEMPLCPLWRHSNVKTDRNKWVKTGSFMQWPLDMSYGGTFLTKTPLLTHEGEEVNTLRPRQNGRHFPDDLFKCIFLNENVWISIKNSLKFVPKGPIDNIPALVQIMAWRQLGDKPLSEPMIVRLPTHICVTWPQWVICQFSIWLTCFLCCSDVLCNFMFYWTMIYKHFPKEAKLGILVCSSCPG